MLNAIVIVAALVLLFWLAFAAARASRRRGQRLAPTVGLVPGGPGAPPSGCDTGIGGVDPGAGPSC